MYLDLLLNLALLVAITVLSGFVAKRWRYGTRRGAAVQNLNLMAGLPETAGLRL